ncbi:MAG TPA: hypothetical protein VGR67_16540 [Candidatus Polarisedimenticolia bacterium]|jgi:hypothetical protein|nr:hypothetical protein [Candidatus Polarisedimenticolia bacterium]
MPDARFWGLALWLMIGVLFGSDASAVSPGAVKKGERFYLAAPVSYWVYRADAKACGLPMGQVRCEGSKDLTVCFYAQGACEWAYAADAAAEEKVVLFPGEASCGGFMVAGEWSAVLFASPEECRNAVPATRNLLIEKVFGYYGSRMIVRRKSD